MIDYAKIEIPAQYGTQLEAHPSLSFRQPVNVQTGEYKDSDAREAEYRGMIFTSYPSGRITLHGSWHKYYHNGTNWQDFTLEQFREAVREFCDTFDLDPSRMELLQLEAGVNIAPPIPTHDTLRAFVCNGKGNAFNQMKGKNGPLPGLEMYLKRGGYGVKVYDKGGQYELTSQLLRFERKYTDWCRFRHKTQIFSLADLLHADAWQMLASQVMESFDYLILREPTILRDELSLEELLFVTEAGTPQYWQRLPRNRRYEAREKMKDYVSKYGSRNLKDELRALIEEKLVQLGTINEGNPILQTRYVLHDIPPCAEHRATVRITTSCNDAKRTREQTAKNETETRRCKTCGRDISNQRSNSIFCSESIYGKAAKKCRNIDSNPRNNYVRSLAQIERYPMLFDHVPFLRAIRHHKPTGT